MTDHISFGAILLLAMTLVCAAPTEDEVLPFKQPEECRGLRFCSVKPEGYEKLEVKINAAIPDFLITDNADRYEPADLIPKLSNKEDWDNCPYVTKLEQMYLYYYGENYSKTGIIVQTNKFKQYVKTVDCAYNHIDIESDLQCFKDVSLNKFNKRTQCVTSHANRTLYVYDIDRSKIIQKYFDVPACCSCRVFEKM